MDSGGESSWTLIFGEAVLAQYFSGGFFFPLDCSRIFPSFRRDVCFSWVCIVISGMCFSYIGGWKSYLGLGSNESVCAIRALCLFGFGFFLGLQSIEAFARDAIDFEKSGFFIT